MDKCDRLTGRGDQATGRWFGPGFILGKLKGIGIWEKELFRDGLAFTKDTRLLCLFFLFLFSFHVTSFPFPFLITR